MKRLAARLRQLRVDAGFSQEAIGAQGFVSAPGYIKVENGQRSASENLLLAFVRWYAKERRLKPAEASKLQEELFLRKYLDDPSLFVCGMAAIAAKQVGFADLVSDGRTPAPKPRRGRPVGSGKGGR